VLGVALGTATGWALAKIAFRSRRPSWRLAETGEPLLALAAMLLSYGVSEVAGGYGFLSVFFCALAMRSAERGHDYHVHMHGVIERLERLLTLVVLLLLGVAMTNGLLRHLTWEGMAVGVLLIFLVRPVSAWLSLQIHRRKRQPAPHFLGPGERLATAFFGVRGVGSLYYVAYATGQADLGDHALLWSTVGFTVGLSVIVHGIAEAPAMKRLDSARAA
jgi:NhaP-type Na+/H+ or K+/H+ antiporter